MNFPELLVFFGENRATPKKTATKLYKNQRISLSQKLLRIFLGVVWELLGIRNHDFMCIALVFDRMCGLPGAAL